jgi:hypothetical protein
MIEDIRSAEEPHFRSVVATGIAIGEALGVPADASAALERIAVNEAVAAYGVHETDADRSSFTVTDRDRGLYLLDADRLEILHRWRLGAEAIGAHAVRATDRVALISEAAAVVLMDADGRRL